jgi:hypothetical protein
LLAFGKYKKNGTKNKGNLQASRGNPPHPTSTSNGKQAAIGAKYNSLKKEFRSTL